jgi:hypothetical protein
VRFWNAQVGTLGAICEKFNMGDELSVSFDRALASSVLKQSGIKYVFVPWIMYELQKHGLISSLVLQETVSFRFKNAQVKRTLTVAGQILELVVAKTMRGIKDKDGSPLYHDVRVGVVIDWDGDDEDEANEKFDTINEIDVIAMKSSVPVFISCKNGDFDANELYKLSSVAERFGGKYAKKVLVSTVLGELGEKSTYLETRMDDMGIRTVDDVDAIGDEAFEKKLKSVWCN